MDNAMVKRGIGAVVLAVIAALLLGYLLKDKSSARQEIVDMKLPGAPEVSIPSLSDAVSNVSDSTATLVGEAKDKVTNAGSAVVASATGTVSNVSDGASNIAEAVTEKASSSASAVTNLVEKNVVEKATIKANTGEPGFSFRPPSANEEQQINTSNKTAVNAPAAVAEQASSNNTVVASSQAPAEKEEKTFKPVIENEPKKATTKIVKKPTPKKSVTKKPSHASKPKASASRSGTYAIQLLATSSQSRANKLAKTMNREGYVSFITQTKSNNKTLYRVRVGGHKDRNAALVAQQSMKRRYQKNFNVQNSLVVSQ